MEAQVRAIQCANESIVLIDASLTAPYRPGKPALKLVTPLIIYFPDNIFFTYTLPFSRAGFFSIHAKRRLQLKINSCVRISADNIKGKYFAGNFDHN